MELERKDIKVRRLAKFVCRPDKDKERDVSTVVRTSNVFGFE